MTLTEAEIIRESWRLHFWRLLQDGASLKQGQQVAEFLGDDEEFERFLHEVEEDVEEKRLQDQSLNTDWEPIE